MPAINQEAYQSPFSTRYGSREMQALFSPAHRARLMRRMWLYLAEAQQELGLPITDQQIAQLKAQAEHIDFSVIDGFERELRHDVMAHLKAYAQAAPLAAPILHLGATSCYVTDNADVLILQDAMRLLRRRLLGTARALSRSSLTYLALPM